MKWYVIPIFIVLLAIPIVTANTNIYCINETTAKRTVEGTISLNGTEISQVSYVDNIQCPYGCDQSIGLTGDCRPDPAEQQQALFLPIIGLIAITFLFFFISFKQPEGEIIFKYFFMLAGFVGATATVGALLIVIRLNNLTEISGVSTSFFEIVNWILILVLVLIVIKLIIRLIKDLSKSAKIRQERDANFDL